MDNSKNGYGRRRNPDPLVFCLNGWAYSVNFPSEKETNRQHHQTNKKMPSFDAVNEIDLQEVDNAINNTIKEIQNRYDFKGLRTEVEFNRKTKGISVVATDSMKMKAVREMLVANFIKRGLSAKSLEFGEPEGTSHGGLKMTVAIREGIDRDNAKKIVKLIKDSKLKVQAAIHDDKVRVTGKKIDDLQEVIAMLRESGLEIPLQFVNMKN